MGWPRTGALYTAVVGAVWIGMAGCGQEGDSGADRAAIQERLAGYMSAYTAGDGERACGAYSRSLRKRADARARDIGLEGCADVLKRVGPRIVRSVPDGDRRRLVRSVSDPRNVRVELDGDRATAGFAPRAGGLLPKRVVMRREDGDWKIDVLGARASSEE